MLNGPQTYGADAGSYSGNDESLVAEPCGERSQQCSQRRQTEKAEQDPLGAKSLGHQSAWHLQYHVADEKRTEYVTLNLLRPRKRAILYSFTESNQIKASYSGSVLTGRASDLRIVDTRFDRQIAAV